MEYWAHHQATTRPEEADKTTTGEHAVITCRGAGSGLAESASMTASKGPPKGPGAAGDGPAAGRRQGPTPAGRVPGIWEQWCSLAVAARVALVAVPLLAIVVATLAEPAAGAAVAVLLVGAAMATVVFFKNRSDRINAAIEGRRRSREDDPPGG